MQYIESWRSPGDGPLALFHRQVLSVFYNYAQFDDRAPESGGILLGHARVPHLELLEATEPSFWDRRMRYFFDRSWRGHRQIALKRHKESKGLIRYLGEWHTHPEDHPIPSEIDVSGWLMLAREREDGHPVLGVIVGRKSLYLELVYVDGNRVILSPSI